jgi:hypothetical protein
VPILNPFATDAAQRPLLSFYAEFPPRAFFQFVREFEPKQGLTPRRVRRKCAVFFRGHSAAENSAPPEAASSPLSVEAYEKSF